MVTGGALTPTFPMWASQFTVDDVVAAVAAAHVLGLPVAAHCHGVEGIAFAVDAGVDTIEHCSFFTSEQRSQADDALIERIVVAGIPVSATLGRDPTSTPPPVIAANLPAIAAGLRKPARQRCDDSRRHRRRDQRRQASRHPPVRRAGARRDRRHRRRAARHAHLHRGRRVRCRPPQALPRRRLRRRHPRRRRRPARQPRSVAGRTGGVWRGGRLQSTRRGDAGRSP